MVSVCQKKINSTHLKLELWSALHLKHRSLILLICSHPKKFFLTHRTSKRQLNCFESSQTSSALVMKFITSKKIYRSIKLLEICTLKWFSWWWRLQADNGEHTSCSQVWNSSLWFCIIISASVRLECIVQEVNCRVRHCCDSLAFIPRSKDYFAIQYYLEVDIQWTCEVVAGIQVATREILVEGRHEWLRVVKRDLQQSRGIGGLGLWGGNF